MSIWQPAGYEFDDDSFSGVARLFPLPDIVMFPRTLQPFHIFEPRYIEMVEDALADDGLIAVVQLSTYAAPKPTGPPQVEQMACLTKIVSHHRLEQGRYNILVVGLRRLFVKEEVESHTSYRRAKAKICSEPKAVGALERKWRNEARQQLLKLFEQALPMSDEAKSALASIFKQEISLGALTDLFASALQLSARDKQGILLQTDPLNRARALAAWLPMYMQEHGGKPPILKDFPPPFSSN